MFAQNIARCIYNRIFLSIVVYDIRIFNYVYNVVFFSIFGCYYSIVDATCVYSVRTYTCVDYL